MFSEKALIKYILEKWVGIRKDLSKLDKKITREPNMELFGILRDSRFLENEMG